MSLQRRKSAYPYPYPYPFPSRSRGPLLGSRRTLLAVRSAENQVVGFAELEPNGHIDRFYCHQDFQRQGIGTALLAAVEEEARRLQLTSLHAEVSTTGIAFFRARGFLVEEERTNTVCNAPAKQFLVRKTVGA